MDKKQTKPVDEPRDKLSRTEQAQQIAQEYADDQREIIKKLRKSINLAASVGGLFHSRSGPSQLEGKTGAAFSR